MSKLLNLKKWLTVSETAAHFSRVLEEDVGEADVLRLALERELEFAVKFVNHAKARKGRLIYVSTEDMIQSLAEGKAPDGLRTVEVPECFRKKTSPNSLNIQKFVLVNDQILPNHWLSLEEDIITLTDVWDLPMIGSNVLDVEHACQMLTGGPEVTLESIDGDSLVGDIDGAIYQLQESFDDNPHAAGSRAHGDSIESAIIKKNIDNEKADELRREYSKQRKAFMDERVDKPARHKHYPAGGLPHDSVFVVRTSAIREFLEDLESPNDDKPTPVSRADAQDAAILGTIEEEGFDASALPKIGAKSAVRKRLIAKRRDLFTDSAFIKAWQRLRDNDQLLDAEE